MKAAVELAERGLLPRPMVRWGIRRLLRDRLQAERQRHEPDRELALEEWLEQMRSAPIALVPEAANEQHYEVPAAFYELVLGPHLKYSSCYYEQADSTLGQAEAAMLAKTCERAELRDGQRVLELGCGWGSLTLWMAEHYPASQIVAVSNSASQREHILARARARGLHNLEVRTCDMNAFETDERFDRVVSVEMFEHMRNWEALLGKIAGWLVEDGRLFIHVFAHARYAYPFVDRGSGDWMSRMFFTGGMMPSDDLMERVRSPLEVEEHWAVEGTHYARTSEHWLDNLDARRAEALVVLGQTYGESEAERWLERWRLFFLACAELFAHDHGREWIVSHYRLRRRGTQVDSAR